MNGPRFIEPAGSLLRRRPVIDPGLLALAGTVLAVLVLLLRVLAGMLDRGLGITLGDIVMRSPTSNRG